MGEEAKMEQETYTGRSILLIGFMGSGKTTIGKRLARELALPFTDTDERIEKRTGRSIKEIFAQEGEAYFRDLETEELRLLLEEGQTSVISVGGGLPVREENRKLMKQLGEVVYLKASTNTLVNRLSGDTTRPLLQGGDLRERIEALSKAREALYLDAATVCFATDGLSRKETVAGIQELLQG